MKRKLFISIGFSIMLLIGGIFFIKYNFNTTKVEQRNFCVVKFQGIEYKWELLFDKQTPISNALHSLGILEVKNIYEIVSGKPKQISINDKITHDSTFKITLR